MKKAWTPRASMLAMTALTSGILIACGGGGSSAGGVLPPVVVAPKAPEEIATGISVLVVDEQGQPITSGVTLQVKSEDGTSAGDAARIAPYASNQAKTIYTVESVTTGLGLISSAADVSADPLDVVFVASSNDYIASSQKVSIKEAGNYIYEIKMVAKNPDPKIPVAAVPPTTVAPTDASAKTTQPIAIATQPRGGDASSNIAEVKGSGGISIDSGTKILVDDGSGNKKPAAAGPLKINVAYFENDTEAGQTGYVPSNGALTAFPGGLDVEVESNTPTNSGETSFSSAGFIAVDLRDADGNVVTNFVNDSDQPKKVSIDITIPEGTPNPDPTLDLNGDKLVNVGEKVPVWSYNELTGKWVAEKDDLGADLLATVRDDNVNDGVYNVTFETTHLSYFNLDFRGDRCTIPGGGSSMTAAVVDSSGAANQRRFKFAGYQTGGGWSRLKTTYDANTTQLVLANMPSFKTTIEFIDDAGDSFIEKFVAEGGATITANNGKLDVGAGPDGIRGNSDDMTLCDLHAGTVHLTKANPASSELVTLDFEVVQACQQDASKKTAYPTKSYVYRPGFHGLVSTEANGKGTIGNLDPNLSYQYFAYIRENNRYEVVRNSFIPKDITNGKLSVVARTVQCETQDPTTGGTGGTGGTSAGGTGG